MTQFQVVSRQLAKQKSKPAVFKIGLKVYRTSSPTDHTLKLINENIVGASGPITDMAGIWNALKNDNMTAHDRRWYRS